MTQKYKEALSEVEYVINQLDKKYLEMIPDNFFTFISENKCKWYEVKKLDDLHEETYAILAIIYRKFLASVEERAELERKYQERLKEETEASKKQFENIDQNVTSEINYNFTQPAIKKKEENQILDLTEYHEKWYMKLIAKIKKQKI